MNHDVVISDIAEIIMGQSPKKKDVNEVGDGYPLLNGPTEFNDKYPEPVQFTTDGRRLSKSGDILFCVRGSTTGRMNYSDQPYAIGRGIAAIRGKNGYPTPFVRAVIEKNLDRLLIAATGSTFPNVSKSLLNEFEVQVISPNKAQNVNEIIVSIEDKIHLNQQTNETLEAMAQAIFKSWFVDFDPVRAKIEARSAGRAPNRAAMATIAGVSLEQDWDTIEAALQQKLDRMSEAQRTQLRQTAALFPDELVESEIGEVPKGWGIDSVFNQAEYINGVAFKGKDFSKSGTGLPVIKIAELKSGITNQTKFTEKEVKDKYHIESGDVMFSWSGNPDTSIDIFIWEGGMGLLNQHVFKIESESKTRKVFNYYFLKSMLPFFKRTAANKQTTGLGHITQKDLKRKQIAIPSNELINCFALTAEPIFDKVFSNLMETQHLSKLRDTLLPKLISGEVGL